MSSIHHRGLSLVLGVGCVLMAATTEAGQQHRWKPASGSESGRAKAIQPHVSGRAAIGGGSNGIYCPDLADGAVGVHDLGWIPAGMNVDVTVESYSDAPFDPAATVLVTALGEKAGNTAKVATFYDNDSGGDKDPKVSFVAPQAGTYLLMVSDFLGKSSGCYRYQVLIF